MEEIGLRHYCNSIGRVLLNRSTRIPIHGSNYNIYVSLKSPSLDLFRSTISIRFRTLFKLAKSARLVLESLSTATNIVLPFQIKWYILWA